MSGDFRGSAGTHVPHPRTQLLRAQLHDVVNRLGEYYAPEEVRLWFHAPCPQLEGRRAIDHIVCQRTTDVVAILDRMYA